MSPIDKELHEALKKMQESPLYGEFVKFRDAYVSGNWGVLRDWAMFQAGAATGYIEAAKTIKQTLIEGIENAESARKSTLG